MAAAFIGLLAAVLIATALDAAVPAPPNPYVSMETETPPALQAELDARRAAISDRLERGQITQEQADTEMAAVDADDPMYGPVVSDAESKAFDAALSARSVTVSVLALLAVALLLGAGVALSKRGATLGDVPLLAGALLSAFAVVVSGSASGVWIRLAVSGAVTAGCVLAGVEAFGATAEAEPAP